MKTVGMREAKALLSTYVAKAQREQVLIMKHGKPAAVLTGVEGKDLEDVLLEHDPKFWKMIHERRKQAATIPLEEVRRRFDIPKSTRKRRSKRAR